MDDSGHKLREQTIRAHTPQTAPGEWAGIPVLKYKEGAETHFRDITKRVLFSGHPDLPTELRYFEVGAGGYSTLERHEHLHVVVVIRGRGQALVGDRVFDLACFDVVQVAAMTWHQFRTIGDEPFGFLCVVSTDRDRPQLPTEADLKELRTHIEVRTFLREVAK